MRTKKDIGKALGRVPSGLFVLTAKCEDREDAVLASWVNQCSFDPPSVTVALSKVRPARLLVEGTEAFILNVLGKESNALIKQFSKPPAGAVFEGLKTSKGFRDIRILSESVSYLECEVVQSQPIGDHVLYVGKVVGGKVLKGGDPYFHVRDNGFNY